MRRIFTQSGSKFAVNFDMSYAVTISKVTATLGPDQSYYTYRSPQGDFFTEKKMRFGLVLGRLAILKKKLGPFMSNF